MSFKKHINRKSLSGYGKSGKCPLCSRVLLFRRLSLLGGDISSNMEESAWYIDPYKLRAMYASAYVNALVALGEIRFRCSHCADITNRYIWLSGDTEVHGPFCRDCVKAKAALAESCDEAYILPLTATENVYEVIAGTF